MNKPKPKPKVLSWVAKRTGPIYCAPACGFKCTYADYNAASKKALKLAITLGNGFVPEVWENMGWHWKVTFGKIAIHERRDVDGPKVWYDGTYDNAFWVEADTPKHVLLLLLQAYEARVRHEKTVIGRIYSALGTPKKPKKRCSTCHGMGEVNGAVDSTDYYGVPCPTCKRREAA